MTDFVNVCLKVIEQLPIILSNLVGSYYYYGRNINTII